MVDPKETAVEAEVGSCSESECSQSAEGAENGPCSETPVAQEEVAPEATEPEVPQAA